MSAAVIQDPHTFLPRFGLDAFRPGQLDVIRAVLEGRDCLCIMPTGGGKSLCFQLPALMRPGVVLVISPLIALMKDQVDGLQRQGIRATFINSSLELAEQRQRLEGIAAGEFDLVYVAPERLRSQRFLETVQQVSVQLLAIDEAHCISEWGHDFRPDYTRIGRFREKLGWPPTIALTATATPDVRQDVIQQLQLREPKIFVTGFARTNLRFECLEPEGTRDKNERLLSLIEETPGAVLIYASTRKRCEEVVAYLEEHLQRRVGFYHAGLMPDDRRRVQEEFMSGKIPVIVATNAFGMGIDKRDLRLVVHYNLPGTLEAYYQEAGRAGRDALPARCVLLFSYSDRYVQEFFIENAYPAREVVREVYEFLRARPEDPIEMTLQQIKDTLNLSITSEGVGTCERLLEKAGAIERLDSQQNQASVKLDSTLPTMVDMLPREAKSQRKILRALEDIVEDRRGEWVFFSLAQLMTAVGMDRDALNRGLRELMRLDAFDYVPPFRGRALHVLTRNVPFKKLNIDFAEMERHKARDLEKLETVIRFAQTRRCRQLEILDYFGDPDRRRCGNCDNCQPVPLKPSPPSELAAEDTVVQVVRMVLSGVARAKERIGKELLAMMLAGSNASRVTKLRLNQLSTYGLLSELRQSDVSELIDAVIEAKLLAYVDLDKFRAVLTLTELGTQVMRGQAHLPQRFSLSRGLLARVRSVRTVKKKPATQPAVTATASSTSENFPGGAPSSAATPEVAQPVEFDPDAEIESGIEPGDEAELDSELDLGTPAANDSVELEFPARGATGWERRPSGSERPTQRRIDLGATDRREAIRPSHYWTWKLLTDGYPAAVCRAIRAIDEETLVSHLLRAAREGLMVDPEWIVSPEQHQQLEPWLSSPGSGTHMPPANLPAGMNPELVQLLREIRRRDLRPET